jgi:hypothetical protein
VSAALFIQHAKCIRRITRILSSVACLTLPHFSLYLINGTIFGQKFLNINYVFWFSPQRLSETFIILRRTERYIIKNVNWSSCKVPAILVRFWWNLNFLHIFSKNNQISHFIKFLSVGTELFHANRRSQGQKDTTKLIVAVRNFAKAPEKEMWE